jgi:phytoene dehydrogenase-like protein
VDPKRAPDGKHILWFEGYAPAHPKAGSWNSLKESVAEETVAFLKRFFPNLDRSIDGSEIDTPEDMEKFDSCFIGGDIMHIRGDLSQSLALRPFPGLPPYRTPIERLYLCGPSTHPGGGVSGGSRTAAQVILQELGIEPAKVMAL